jgi:hypothetical protein
MWTNEKASEGIHTELCDYINEFLDEINRLRDIKEQEKEEANQFFNNANFKEYIRIYELIEDKMEKVIFKIQSEGMFDYCGKGIKDVISTLGIQSELVNENTDYHELDNVLAFIDYKAKHLSNKIKRANNWNFLIVMTLFDNFLVNNVRLLYQKLSILTKEKKDEKTMQFGQKSLVDQVKWFICINPKFDYPNDKLVIYNAKRNAIVHSAAIVSERIIYKIPTTIQKEYNFKIGMKIEIDDDELLEIYDELNVLANNIFRSITEKFCMTFDELGLGYTFEQYDLYFKDVLSKIKVSEWS